MNTPAQPQGSDAPAGAHLLIHLADTATDQRWSLQALARRLRAPFGAPAASTAAGLLALEVHDQQGQSVLTLDLSGPLVDVALPPGIYRVTARRGKLQRSYTVALSSGSSFDLQLELPRTAH